MSAQKWEVENVPDSAPVIPPDNLYDILQEAIDSQATAFPEPAKFRTAIYYILSKAATLNVDEIAATLAWKRLERVFAALEAFKDPAITLDAMRCLAHMNDEQGVFIAELARKHNITRQSLFKRIVRLGKFLGVEYRRTKPHKDKNKKPTALYGVGGFVVSGDKEDIAS